MTEESALDMHIDNPSRQILSEVSEDLKRNFTRYFSEEYLEFRIFQVGAFLDPRVYHTMPFVQKRCILENVLPGLVSQKEDRTPSDLKT